MKIFITGSNGLLGNYLIEELYKSGHLIFATGRGPNRSIPEPLLSAGEVKYTDINLVNGPAMNAAIRNYRPDLIIHAGAMTQVDICEQNPVDCWNTNVTATRFIIDAAKVTHSKIVYVSTDFVFSGSKGMYSEEDDTGPVNYYGTSKLTAEKAVKESGLPWAIARTVLVYGNAPVPGRSNILTWVRDSLQNGKAIKVVNDQVRTPTFAGDLAKGIRLIAERAAEGIFHLSGKDVLTPCEMAVETAEYLQLDKSLIEKVNGDVFSQPALRPLRTGFNIEKAVKVLGYQPLSFREGLSLVFGGKK